MRKAEKQRIIEEGFKGYKKAKRICRTCEFYDGVCFAKGIAVETEKNNTCEGWGISLNAFIKQVDRLGEELRGFYLADFIDFDVTLL